MNAEESTNATQKIGRYRITGELGRGGMGVVYSGEDRLIGRRVAIKTLTEVTPELRERFYIEARSGILSHPNIVTVYELGEHEGIPFIAMEFIDGDSLEKILRQRRQLPLLEALSIVEQLCAGLGYAHGHGVVHRDVKPANVLVRPDGRVTIVDFGIARLADQTRQLTKTDTLLGTFHYIAPERLKGEASDGRADIWSIGVMLYEMLTGELPFKGSDVSSLYRVIHEPYVPLTEHVQGLPDGLSRVLDKALAKQVDARYATAEEMAFDLQMLAEGLKHDRLGALLETARRLTDESQYTSARTVLLQAQRIDPTNIDAKALLGEVQDRLSQVHRGGQLRQLIEQAQAAANGQRWDDAIPLFQQARNLDTEDEFKLDERLQQAQKEKVQQQKVLVLWKQAEEARNLGDLTKAQDCLDQALKIDDRSTELRNAYSDVQHAVRHKQQQLRVEELLRIAQEESSRQRYTESISRLREAAEIDPLHAEVQALLFSMTVRQKEERRKQVLDQAASNVRESIDHENFKSAEEHVTHALETLPGDEMLLRLQSEIEGKKQDADIQRVVRSTVLEAQEFFANDPKRALRVIEQGLKKAPDSNTLIQSRARLLEHLKEQEKAPVRTQAPEEAKARQNSEAQRVSDATMAVHSPSVSPQLPLSKADQEKLEKTRREAAPEEVNELLRTAQFTHVIGRIKPPASANNDVEQLKPLEDTPRKQDEAAVPVGLPAQFTEVLSKAQAETPSSMQKQLHEENAKKDAVEADVNSRRTAEIRTAVEKAVAACDKAIAAAELDRCMRPLDDLVKQLGENAAFATAREACESKRRRKATQMLRDAVQAAQRQLRNGSSEKAEGSLKGVEYVHSFADADARGEWQRLKGECAAALRVKQQVPKPGAPARSGKASRYVGGAAAAIVVLTGVGLLHHWHKAPPPQKAVAVLAPIAAGPPTDVEINASPWATVVSVQDKTGKNIALPSGEQTTPLRLDGLNAGTYKVTFAGADGGQQIVECNVSSGSHLCVANMGLPDTDQVLMGEQQ
jgi:serine/threonine protein kinase